MKRDVVGPLRVLLFGAAAALLLGLLAGELVRGAIAPARRLVVGEATAPLSNGAPLDDVASPALGAGLGRAFGLDATQRIIEPAPAADPATMEPARLRLLGTLVANRDAWSRALVRDLMTGDVRLLRIGDSIGAARIVSIERDPLRIQLQDEVGRVLEVLPSDEPPAALPPPPARLPGVERRNETDYRIERAALLEALAKPETLLTSARALPYVAGGELQGFRVSAIRPGSLYEAIGLRNGDVVSAVNGLVIDTPEKALELLARLRDARFVEIDLQRDGRTLRRRYDIR